jgi:serine/threonine-protein kinase
MALAAGTRLGPYDILAPLGAGGMGEVYRATDTKLKRQVAVKILPPALAADPDRLARFQREAEVLASLNHPHIAAIYGLEDADGMKALVMELVEGPTLADRIAEGPIPIDEALPIAAQVAEALEAAHEQGIVHRDLKPANIKVRDDGTVKVLDFGLAKLAETGGAGRAGSTSASDSPTLTSPAAMTGMGMILGTAAYMSPEQARGRSVDKRSDVWAFGAVLYEMLTGARAFEGEDVTEIMASVMKSTPNWAALPAEVPPHVVTLIQRCLDKDRHARIGDIAVARFLLSGHAILARASSSASASASAFAPASAAAAAARVPGAAATGWRQTLARPWVIAAVLGGLLAGTLVGWFLPRRAAGALPVTHLQMGVSPADTLVSSNASARPSRTAMALSPDGRVVAFSGMRGNMSQGVVTQLYVRALDRADATPVPGTEGATAPFFSPDGAWIGFWADNKIKKVPAAGGPPATICDVPPGGGLGASWGADGTIFFGSFGSRDGISKVPSAGGTPAKVTTGDSAKGERLLLPHALPDGKSLLLTVLPSNDWDTANIVLLSLDTGERRVLVQGGADARYVGTGHLVYMKSGTMMAVPFDYRSRQVTGAPVALIENVMQAMNAANGSDETGAGQFAVSASGTLVYATGGPFSPRQVSPVWVDRAGNNAQPIAATPAASFLGPRLSPDGRRLAVAVRRVSPRGSDLWVYDMVRGAPTRLTFAGTNGLPVWSPDSRRVVYGTSGTDADGLYVVNADGGGKPERVADAGLLSSWAAATNTIAFLQRAPGVTGIWVLPMEGDRKPRLFLESRFTLQFPTLSPDGRSMAYVSSESGGSEVYVQPYPGPGEKIRVSTAGGFDPIWTANGRELLYRSAPRSGYGFFSAAARSQSPLQFDAPRLLFEARPGEYDATAPDRSWDVTADGQRFLLMRPVESTDRPVTAMHVVLNWADELKRLAPAK